MKSYNFFAKVYDDLTDNVNYKVRSDYISDFFNKYNVHSGDTILDLACGTGSISAELINLGYKVIGMDLSSEMLSIAASKLNGSAVLLNGNMKNFKLPQKVKGVVCSLDSLNHLADIQEVKQCFNSVYNCLDNNGIFIFDVNTIFKHNNVLANNTFVFDEENYFLSWDNELAENNKVRILIDIFYYNGTNYDRYSEEFIETAFSTDELKSVLTPYFNVLGIYDELTDKPPKNDSQRLYFICERKNNG